MATDDVKTESPTAPPGNELALAIPPELSPRGGTSQFWISSVPKTDLDRALVLEAMLGELPKLGDSIGTVLRIKDVAFQSLALVNEQSGEVEPAVRTVVFCDDGKAYSAVSDGIHKSMSLVFGLWGKPPWNPAKPFVVRQLSLKGGHRYYYLQYEVGEPPPSKTRGR